CCVRSHPKLDTELRRIFHLGIGHTYTQRCVVCLSENQPERGEAAANWHYQNQTLSHGPSKEKNTRGVQCSSCGQRSYSCNDLPVKSTTKLKSTTKQMQGFCHRVSMNHACRAQTKNRMPYSASRRTSTSRRKKSRGSR